MSPEAIDAIAQHFANAIESGTPVAEEVLQDVVMAGYISLSMAVCAMLFSLLVFIVSSTKAYRAGVATDWSDGPWVAGMVIAFLSFVIFCIGVPALYNGLVMIFAPYYWLLTQMLA